MKKNTEFGPEIKRVTLHPLKDDGTIDTDINLYPKTLIDGVVNRDGQLIAIQEKLIAGDNIIIENNVISTKGGPDDTYTKEEADAKFLSKEEATEEYVSKEEAEDFITYEEAEEEFVAKEVGKGLSSNDYTDEDKALVENFDEFVQAYNYFYGENGEIEFPHQKTKYRINSFSTKGISDNEYVAVLNPEEIKAILKGEEHQILSGNSIALYQTGLQEELTTAAYGYDSIDLLEGKIYRYCKKLKLGELLDAVRNPEGATYATKWPNCQWKKDNCGQIGLPIRNDSGEDLALAIAFPEIDFETAAFSPIAVPESGEWEVEGYTIETVMNSITNRYKTSNKICLVDEFYEAGIGIGGSFKNSHIYCLKFINTLDLDIDITASSTTYKAPKLFEILYNNFYNTELVFKLKEPEEISFEEAGLQIIENNFDCLDGSALVVNWPVCIQASYSSVTDILYNKDQIDEKFQPKEGFSYITKIGSVDKNEIEATKDIYTVLSNLGYPKYASAKCVEASEAEEEDKVPFIGDTFFINQYNSEKSYGYYVISGGKVYWFNTDGATEIGGDEKLIAKQDFPSIDGTSYEDSYFRVPAPISSTDDLRDSLETLDSEFIKKLIGEPEDAETNQYLDNFGEVWKFERTSENSADVTLIIGDIKYTTSVSIEVDAETGDSHVAVGEVFTAILADNATTMHKTNSLSETITGEKTFSDTLKTNTILPETSGISTLGSLDYRFKSLYLDSSGINIKTKIGGIERPFSIYCTDNDGLKIYDGNYTIKIYGGGISPGRGGQTLGADGHAWASINVNKLRTNNNNYYGLILPDTTNYTDNRVIATENYVDNSLSTKQDTLVSGTNIKTINNESLLGSGDITISGGYDIYDYDDTAETAERIYNDQPAAIKVSQPDTDLEVYLHKVEFRDNVHYYSGSTFNENLGGWVTVVLKVIFDGNETYSSETSYYHSYSEIDFGQTGGEEEVYLQQPTILHFSGDGESVFLQKTDFQNGELFYRAPVHSDELGGDVIYEMKFFTYEDEETGETAYDYDTRIIPVGGQPQPVTESDLTIMTDPADMAAIVHAYATGDSTGFKENHKYGLSGDEFVDFFTDSLNSEDLYWLMKGRSYENRLIMFNGEKLKLDKSVTDTYRLHNSDDSVQITLVRAEEDTVTVNISDQFAYLEIIFFHYEGE